MNSALAVISPIAVAIPLLVSAIVCVVARREGSAIPVAAMLRLAAGTAAAAVAIRFFPNGLLLIGLSLTLFAVLAIPVMRELERTAAARITPETVRSADLVARDLSAYVPLWMRGALVAAAAGLLLWVVFGAIESRPSLLTFGLAFAGVVFFALYETWMRQEVFSVRARNDAERRARVRLVFAAQIILTTSLLLFAALSAGTWPGLVPLGATAAVVGGAGCALALSTGVQERYLRAWSAARSPEN